MALRSRLVWLALIGSTIPMPAAASTPLISLYGGINVATVDGKSSFFIPKSKLGFAGGAALDIPLGGHFGVVPEVGYAIRGFSWGKSGGTDPYGNPTGSFETFTVTDVITVSAAARASMPLIGAVQGRLLVGPTVGFKVAEHFTTSNSSTSQSTDALRDPDFGVLSGAGLDVPAGPGSWGLGARYVLGLMDLSRDPTIRHRTRELEVVSSYSYSFGH